MICEKNLQKSKDLLIYENEDWLISHGPIDSQILGYLYVEPKRHVENWSDFTEEELVSIGPLIKKAEVALKKVLLIDRVYCVTISEAVRHIHFHLIPRIHGEEVKGISLIEQATQRKIKTNKFISEDNFVDFVASLKNNF